MAERYNYSQSHHEPDHGCCSSRFIQCWSSGFAKFAPGDEARRCKVGLFVGLCGYSSSHCFQRYKSPSFWLKRRCQAVRCFDKSGLRPCTTWISRSWRKFPLSWRISGSILREAVQTWGQGLGGWWAGGVCLFYESWSSKAIQKEASGLGKNSKVSTFA